jgi:hypothetical protein
MNEIHLEYICETMIPISSFERRIMPWRTWHQSSLSDAWQYDGGIDAFGNDE